MYILQNDWANFDSQSCIDSPIRSNGAVRVDHGLQSMCPSFAMPSINAILDNYSVASEFGHIMAELNTRIRRTYELILENREPSKINAAKDVLAEIA